MSILDTSHLALRRQRISNPSLVQPGDQGAKARTSEDQSMDLQICYLVQILPLIQTLLSSKNSTRRTYLSANLMAVLGGVTDAPTGNLIAHIIAAISGVV